ncbi:hypothetical protein HNR46_003166 [Haloferula luteola]|uniref:Uncharacterized protein n=1 Tax=Haloferula luteola TaxID=595692 RepID=A0A840V3P2_9BACT|nr:hypothetical protein [Haloferula luteola]MBB5352917.1 hypothetical protein [Haloferula luteola]
MKIAPTLDGRVRVDLENEKDIWALISIVVDAGGAMGPLSDQVAGGMGAEFAEDWREWVVPDLADQFRAQLSEVAGTMEGKAPGDSFFIAREQAELWYGALNQARRALHAQRSSSPEDTEPDDSEVRRARILGSFYDRLQILVFETLMEP